MLAARRRLGPALTLALASTCWSGRVAAQGAEPPAEPIEVLVRKQEARLAVAEERLRRQDEQIAALTRALEAAKREPPPSGPTPIESALHAVRLSGFVQADAVLHRQSSQNELSPAGEPLNQDRFSI